MDRFDYELNDFTGEYEIVDRKQGSFTSQSRYIHNVKTNPVAIVYDLDLAQLMVYTLNRQDIYFKQKKQ